MSRKIAIFGAATAAFFPFAFLILALFAQAIPGCVIGGSGEPAYGCAIWGLSFNWLITWATPAFASSFFTVPLGLLLLLVGGSSALFERRRARTRSYGINDPYGRRLSPAEVPAEIKQFDRGECDALLRAFGEPPRGHSESLEDLRARCVRVTAKVDAGA